MTRQNRSFQSAMALCLVGFLAELGSPSATAASSVVRKVGQVTWHAQKFVDQNVVLTGYLLAREKDYILFSDEPGGKISAHDLPVSGQGLDLMLPLKKYVIEGKLLDHGLQASNGNPYHLELTVAPRVALP
jgi:hypothetical protein